ncbi:MAG TPA: response regulator, partial [bacterium]
HAVPLVSRDGVCGVLHALLAPGAAPGAGECAFLDRVAALLGAELQRRRLEEEHRRLESRFLQAQKLEAVGRLAGGVAHDFNNILTAITSYAELGLLRLDGASPLRRNFGEILAAADRAALLTQQLLAFSRSQHLAPRPVDLGAVIAEMGKMLRRLLGEDVELEVRAAHGAARVFADPVQVEQVVINLALAARDALPGGGRLLIETEGAGGDARGAALRLSFRGPGAGTLSEERGEREDRPGAPLGLAAVRGIVERSGGDLRIFAEDGGTVVHVRFPGTDPGKDAPAGAIAPQRGSETILLAEDDESVRCVIGVALRDLGYRVVETRGGREALDAARQSGPVDLLLADVVMPGMSGPQLARELRRASGPLRVLYVSGCTDEVLERHGALAAGAHLLRKPFSPAMLGDRVRRVLDAPPSPA